VRGEFTDFEGVFEIGADLESSRAYGKVKTASIDTNEPARDEHLRSADFFDAETNPEITFASTKIEQLDDEALKVSGNLTINGITNEETFYADVQGTETDPWGNDRVGLEVSGQISRGDYGMKFNQASAAATSPSPTRSGSSSTCRPSRLRKRGPRERRSLIHPGRRRPLPPPAPPVAHTAPCPAMSEPLVIQCAITGSRPAAPAQPAGRARGGRRLGARSLARRGHEGPRVRGASGG